MTLLLLSFVAGLLTVLAPCVLPLLPVIVGGSISDSSLDTRSRLKPYVITASLAVSVVIFTLILKVGTDYLNIDQSVWNWLTGIILVAFSLTMIFPKLWFQLTHGLKIEKTSNVWLAKASNKKSFWGDILMGLSLGPVFTSCSPTYAVILATVLPQSFALGLINLFSYAIGLGLVLLLVALIGQRFVSKINFLSDPNGWFKKLIGVIFLLVGITIITGDLKKLETVILDSGFLPAVDLEADLLDNAGIDTTSRF